jgi:hypothetical protein
LGRSCKLVEIHIIIRGNEEDISCGWKWIFG